MNQGVAEWRSFVASYSSRCGYWWGGSTSIVDRNIPTWWCWTTRIVRMMKNLSPTTSYHSWCCEVQTGRLVGTTFGTPPPGTTIWLVHATSLSTRKLDPYPPSSRTRIWTHLMSTTSVVWFPGVDSTPLAWMCGEIVRSRARSIVGGRGGSWPARIGSVHSFTRCTAPAPTWCDGNADPWMLHRRSTSSCPRIGAPRSISEVDLRNLFIRCGYVL